MLILLLLYYLGQGAFSGAVPLPSIIEERRTPSTCNDLHACRTIWNIIWSCLVTIFSCTWVAIHPNIPYPGKKKDIGRFERWVWHPLRSSILHRLPLFICALLVPEYILSWAIRQRRVAGQIAKDNNGMSINAKVGNLLMLSHDIQDGQRHMVFSLSWEGSISFATLLGNLVKM